MNPQWPVYVPTKGRWESRHTIRAFDAMHVPYRAVIEPQEVDRYLAAGVARKNILVLPFRDRGLVTTRNWIWDHALASGAPWYWTFDDNIRCVYRMTRNTKVRVGDGTVLRVLEDFAARYSNLVVTGMHYDTFANRKYVVAPFKWNKRVYSNMLIRTDARDGTGKPYRCEGVWNDDTDLNLRVLKDGNCTALFNTFQIGKCATMTVKGGLTEIYTSKQDGEGRESDTRYRATKELKDKHPDVVTVTRKWGRWHHHVDYSPFRTNRPVRDDAVPLLEGVNEYGMLLWQFDRVTGSWGVVDTLTGELSFPPAPEPVPVAPPVVAVLPAPAVVAPPTPPTPPDPNAFRPRTWGPPETQLSMGW